MTPHTPSAAEPAHPDIDEIADLAEGLTDPAAEPALRAHLATCASCADTLAALSEVQDLLSSVDTPPMPDDVALRIDTALAAARTPAAASPEPAGASRTVPDGHGRHTAPTASGPGSTAWAGTATRPGPGGPGRRRGRRRAVLAAVAGVALGLGALLVPLSARTTGGNSTADSAARPAAGAQQPGTKTGTDFDEATLPDRIGQLVRSATGSPAAAGPDASGTPGAPGLQPPEGTPPGGSATVAPPCAAALTGREPGALVTAAPGRFHASPVTALVYAVPGQDTSLDVYLITPDCAAPGILLHRTVPAP
ncbi:hypothetical protein KNE206_70170 [Kitasatospora sp. NE20-6]|uniref:anti-sigma factor family protein n=1 Tax=Kitasatospora sp. NE20-6 TaxID=2859066 RepID=UPI0034DC6AF2